MAQDKEVQLNFNYGDGTTDTVSFLVPAGETGPQGPQGEIGPQGETGPAGDPASVCDSFTTLPVSDEFGDDPQIIVRSGGQCRVVNVPSKGIFTDVRSQAAWSGIALEGDTNTFIATARNVSVTNAGKIRVDIVLPTLPDNGIEYGTTTVSAPNGILVTPIITTGANRSYYVENLNSGVNVSFNTPVTWNVKGTYQASMTVNAVDPNTVDYSSSDDYSVASYTVAHKSDGEGTIDCPLIMGKIGTTDLSIGSAPTNNVIDTSKFIAKCLGIVLDADKSFTVEFNRAVTIYAMNRMMVFGTYDVQSDSNGYGGASYRADESQSGNIEIIALDGTNTKFKIKFVGGGNATWGLPTQTLACFGVKVSANCNTQYFGVSADAGYKIGQTIDLTSNGATAPVSHKTTKFSSNSYNTYDIRHVDGTTHQLLMTGVSGAPFYKVEGLDITMQQATVYDLTIAATLTPTTLSKTHIIRQTTTGTVTVTYPNPTVNTVRLVTSDNTSDHDSTTNGLLKYTFVQ